MKFNAFFLIFLTLALGSCTDQSEQDAISQAQRCLDQVSESDPTQASKCMGFIADYVDQQSAILKCAILDTSAGLVESKIVAAYNQLQTTSSVPSAAFLAALGLSTPDATTALATAQAADVFCQASGVRGLQYVSSGIVLGTFMLATYGHTIDPSDSSSVSSAVQSLIMKCEGSPSSANCQPATIGSQVINLSSQYCSTPNADKTICGEVSSAKTAAGNDPTKVGQAFLCYLNNQTYNPTLAQCQ